MIPQSRPKLPALKVRAAIARALDGAANGSMPSMAAVNVAELQKQCPLLLVANRAYYLDSMGRPKINDFGIYDDAAWIVTDNGVLPFNWNVDPSRDGWNASLGKPYANLVAGLWPFILGKHKGQYDAFRQPYDEQAKVLKLETVFKDRRALGEFKVKRNNPPHPSFIDEGYHAINIHSGSNGGTSSWGCQTCPPAQWHDLQSFIYSYMRSHEQKWLPYLLIEGPLS